jgi:hypothetical protein
MPAASTIHVVHGLLLPSAAFISQVEQGSIEVGAEPITMVPAGFPQPLALHVGAVRPMVNFSTSQLATLLTAAGVYGYDTSGGNTDFFAKAASDLAVRVADATTSHLRFRATQGLLNWTSINAQQDQIATAQCRFCPTFDGTNAPLVAAGSLALSGTPSASECYLMGPVYHNGSGLPGVTGWTLDLGIEFYPIASDGEPYLTFLGVKEIRPVLTIRGVRAANLVTYTLGGTAVTSSLACYLRRKTADGGFYADGSSQHIKFAATNGILLPSSASGGGNEPFADEVRILLRPATASAQTLTITTATTVP